MTELTGSLLVVCSVCESGEVNGGVIVISWVSGLRQVLGSSSEDVSFGEPGFSLGGAS